ncbi:MAG: histidine phosphatase family protein [Bdellovibrionales bacterium]
MLFYFIRHGETDANRQQLLAGAGMDHPLNLDGRAQARRLASVFRELVPHPIHRLLVSSMTRTRQTAEPLAEALALEIQLVPDFREWHLGEWEGKSFFDFGHLLLGEGEPAGGEARQVFYSRIEQTWRAHHCDQNPYVIVSHGAVWLALQDLLKMPRFKVSNCDIVKVQSDGTRWCAQILSS